MADINKTPVKELGVKTVLYWIFMVLVAILFISCGIVPIQSGRWFVGILFFILTILLFVPHRYFRVTATLKGIIILILFFVFAAISGSNTPAKEQKTEKFNLSQKFNLTLGDTSFSMTVRETKLDTKLTTGEKVATTSGYYLIIKGDAENLGSTPAEFKLSKSPEVKDSKNRLFTLHASTIPEAKLQPGVPTGFTYVFEIPKEYSSLNLFIKDSTDTVKMVSLGL